MQFKKILCTSLAIALSYSLVLSALAGTVRVKIKPNRDGVILRILTDQGLVAIPEFPKGLPAYSEIEFDESDFETPQKMDFTSNGLDFQPSKKGFVPHIKVVSIPLSRDRNPKQVKELMDKINSHSNVYLSAYSIAQHTKVSVDPKLSAKEKSVVDKNTNRKLTLFEHLTLPKDAPARKSDEVLKTEIDQALALGEQVAQAPELGGRMRASGAGDSASSSAHCDNSPEVPAETLFSAYQKAYELFKRDPENAKLLVSGAKSRSARLALKQNFVSFMWKTMGPKAADQVIVALTAFGEAGTRKNENELKAELAAVVRNIQNRAVTDKRTDHSGVLDADEIDVVSDPKNAYGGSNREGWDSTNDNRRMAAALANLQYSVWNLGDPNLLRMTATDPNSKGASADLAQLKRAFEVVAQNDAGKIEYSAGLADQDNRHYHSAGTSANWAKRSLRVKDVSVKFEDSDWTSVVTHIFYHDVALAGSL